VQKKQTDLVFGLRPLIEALQNDQAVEKIMMQRGLQGELSRELTQLARKLDVTVQFVPVEKLNRVVRGNHQGAIGFVSPVQFYQLDDLLPSIYERGETPLFLMMDGVTDVRNFGAMVRTAECAGVHAIIIPHTGAARINADAVKTSAGALYNVPICRVHSFKDTLKFMQQSGIQVVACTEKAPDNYYPVKMDIPTAIIMGSEEKGISTSSLRYCDVMASIPMQGQIKSLNVSVACAVLLYEAVRQRQ